MGIQIISTPPAADNTPPAASLAARALDAQRELLPYAVIFFCIALPAFVWAGAYARNAAWMSAIFAQFSLNWAAVYATINIIAKRGAPSLRQRATLHVGAALLWALVVDEIAVFGLHAGAVGELILAMDIAFGVACMFFAAPSLQSLSVVGLAAGAAPVIALYLSGASKGSVAAGTGAVALGMALSLVLNRILRRQFLLAQEREALTAERVDSLAGAEKLAKSKSQILATLSHEIRNGLTGITHVLAAAVGAGGRAAPSREQLAAALAGARELLEVLNATLDTETAGQGRLSIAAVPFDAARLARSTVLLHRPKAAAKHLELDIHVDEGLERGVTGATVGDPMRTRQILANLIGNAVKYTARGRVEVRVQLVGSCVRFEVADTGPGLSPEELERAFQPFSRIERIGVGLPGAGLGLSLSRELAKLMGGDISAESAVGVGSRFWFDLPFDTAASAPADDEETEDLESPGGAKSAYNLRILVAEDDALNAAMLRAVLEQLGHQVVHAHDGRRALELIEFCHFDLVMLDGRMPNLSGPETARAIRAMDQAAAGTPIIAVIGGDAAEAEDCMNAGVDEVLRKPVTVSAVARAVTAAVDRSEFERTAFLNRQAAARPA